MNNQKGLTHLLLLSVFGILAFILVSSTTSFQNSLFSSLYPKPSSHAATAIDGLHVSGGQILNSANQPVRLVGVNFSGAEYTCIKNGGNWDVPADQNTINAMKTWNIKAVRVTLNEDCWLGVNGITSTFAQNHRTAVVSFTNLLIQNGMVPIINLHFSGDGVHPVVEQEPMANRVNSINFWISVANTFKGNSSVILEPYNEPHLEDTLTDRTQAWTCWRDGGCSVRGSNSGEGSFVVAGMQEMVNAIRNTGATNVIIVTGENWGSDLGADGGGYGQNLDTNINWVKFKPTDPLNQLAAGWHQYGDGLSCSQNPTCWNNVAGYVINQGYPIVATEIGEFDCTHNVIDPLMNWLDSHKAQGYQAWTWGPFDCRRDPALLTDYAGSPSQTYGQGFKAHLLSLASATPAPTGSSTPTPIPTPTPTVLPTPTAVPTATPTPTPFPTSTPLPTPTPNAVSSVLEAENMSLVPNSGAIQVFADSSASGGQALVFYSNATSNGSISTSVNTNLVVVRAKADSCKGNAHMFVNVDGRRVLDTNVSSTTWSDYSVNTSLAAGTHSVSVIFDNDFISSKGKICDRNLRLDKITLQ